MTALLLVIFAIIIAVLLYFRAIQHGAIIIGGAQKQERFYRRDSKFENISMRQNYAKLLEGYKDVYYSTDTTEDLFTLYYPHLEKYQDTKGLMTFSMHIGQLKLILNEIQFLTYCLDSPSEKSYVIYAGSSPSNKGFYFTKLFPGSTFILIDPHEHYVIDRPGHDQYSADLIESLLYFRAAENNRFDIKNRRINMYGKGIVNRDDLKEFDARPVDLADAIKSTKQQIIIIEELMDEKMAAEFAKLPGKILFISDIRTAVSGYNPHDVDILFNSAQQMWWISLIKPLKYMLKFRPPFDFSKTGVATVKSEIQPYMKSAFSACKDLGVDFIADHHAGKFRFFKYEHIWLQPFGREFTAETRLVGSEVTFADYPHTAHEDYMYYFNTVKRPFGFHYEHEKYLDKEIGIDRCGDCALMCKILSRYYSKYGLEDQTKKTIEALLKTISRRLKTDRHYHGNYYERLGNNIRYVIETEFAVMFVREYGHLAELRTKKKSLNHFYRRYLARRAAGSNNALKDKPNVYDFISKKSKFAELFMKFGVESDKDFETVREMNEIMAGDAQCPELRLDGNTLHIGNFVETIQETKPASGLSPEKAFIRFVRAAPCIIYDTDKYTNLIEDIICDKNAQTVHFIALYCNIFKPSNSRGVCCTVAEGYCDMFSVITDLLIVNIDGHHRIIKYLVGKKLLASDRPTIIFCHTFNIPLSKSYWAIDGLVPIRCWMFSNFDLAPYLSKINNIDVEKVGD